MSKQGDEIRDFIIRHVRKHPKTIAALAAKQFAISRQAVNKHLTDLIDRGLIAASGQTRGRSYDLARLDTHHHKLPIVAALEEDVVWRQCIHPGINGVPSNAYRICEYGFTEMVNNVVDHSEGRTLELSYHRTAADVTLWVEDDGVGIFNKIAGAMQLADARQSILELAKGKFTTDPDRHSGEGIFFTSRACDQFMILSGQLSFIHEAEGDDWLFQERIRQTPGTEIMMRVNLDTTRTVKEVFDRFAAPDEYTFSKTHVPLALAQVGESNLVSRSQARRVLTRIDRFQEVLLDFDGVKTIGQAFADEIFRVFARNNPQIRLIAINMTQDVQNMINRAKAN